MADCDRMPIMENQTDRRVTVYLIRRRDRRGLVPYRRHRDTATGNDLRERTNRYYRVCR